MARELKRKSNPNIGERLKKLRNNRKLSLSKTAKLLEPYVDIQLDGKSGETRISGIENSNANLTLELAIAYSKVFNVSLEYLFCLSDDMQPNDKGIREELGLTDIAISKIRDFSNTDSNTEEYPKQLEILNILFESDFMTELIQSLDSFIYTTNLYRGMETLNFDERENDKEIVNLLPRWKLDKSVSISIDKIANLLETTVKLKIC